MNNILGTETLEEMSIRNRALAEAGNHRNVICPAIYKNFQHSKDGTLNNHMYVTMFVSKPLKDYNAVLNGLFNTVGVNIITVKLTEDEYTITLFEKEGQYYHNPKDSDVELMIYKSLYDCSRFPHAEPLDMFASEIGDGKYKFEIVRY
jgi:hypothetical protein